MNIINYKQKYLKYKQKYLKLKKLYGGNGNIHKYLFFPIEKCSSIDEFIPNDTHDMSKEYLKGEINSQKQRYIRNIEVLTNSNIGEFSTLKMYDCTENTIYRNYIEDLDLDLDFLNIRGPIEYSFYYINKKKILLFADQHILIDDIKGHLPFIIFSNILINYFSKKDRCLDFFMEMRFNELKNKFTIDSLTEYNTYEPNSQEVNEYSRQVSTGKFKTIDDVRRNSIKYANVRNNKYRFQTFDLREFGYQHEGHEEKVMYPFYSPVLFNSDKSTIYSTIFFKNMLNDDFSKENLINNFTYLFKFMLNKIDATHTELNGKIETYINDQHTENKNILNVDNTKIIRDKILKQFNSNEKKEKILDYFILLLTKNLGDIIDDYYINRIEDHPAFNTKMIELQKSTDEKKRILATEELKLLNKLEQIDGINNKRKEILVHNNKFAEFWYELGSLIVDIYNVGRMFKTFDTEVCRTADNIIYFGGKAHYINIRSVFNNIIGSEYKHKIYYDLVWLNIYSTVNFDDIRLKLPYFLENVEKVNKIEVASYIVYEYISSIKTDIITYITTYDISVYDIIDVVIFYENISNKTYYTRILNVYITDFINKIDYEVETFSDKLYNNLPYILTYNFMDIQYLINKDQYKDQFDALLTKILEIDTSDYIDIDIYYTELNGNDYHYSRKNKEDEEYFSIKLPYSIIDEFIKIDPHGDEIIDRNEAIFKDELKSYKNKYMYL